MNRQLIISPSGERLVVLAESDYRALVEAAEEAEDLAAVRRFKERLAAGEEELLPAAMVDRLLEGESPLRVWRQHRGLSIKALAERVGIASAYLSQMETGKREGTVETLRKLAQALGITLDELAG